MNIAAEVARLRKHTVTELRAEYASVFGEPTRSSNKDFLVRRIVWRLQANAAGGLSERARRRAAELARDSDLRVQAPRTIASETTIPLSTITGKLNGSDLQLPMPGSILTRAYRGRMIQVRVLPSGFEFEGETYHSLTAVAEKVTGSHWSGNLFFRLRPSKSGTPKKESRAA